MIQERCSFMMPMHLPIRVALTSVVIALASHLGHPGIAGAEREVEPWFTSRALDVPHDTSNTPD